MRPENREVVEVSDAAGDERLPKTPPPASKEAPRVLCGMCNCALPDEPAANEDDWRRPVSVAESIATADNVSNQQASADQTDGLIYYSREPLRLKNFTFEVRAPMDVEQFAHQAELVLDSPLVSMSDIIDSMLTKVRRAAVWRNPF